MITNNFLKGKSLTHNHNDIPVVLKNESSIKKKTKGKGKKRA